jgi:hypothetical protein
MDSSSYVSALQVAPGASCSDVLVTKANGEQEIKPAYDHEELVNITSDLWWRKDDQKAGSS